MIVGITGATGFIGRVLVDRCLERGFETRVLVRLKSKSHLIPSSAQVFQGDMVDESFNPNKFTHNLDVLYNCAGNIIDESKMYSLHVKGTNRLITAASGRIGRWVQLSSVGAYGGMRTGVITESSAENPLGEYEVTKTNADILLKKSGLPYVILRPSTVFALTMNNQSLFKLVKMIQNGLFFYIGRAGAVVNYVHVEDVVDALVACGFNNQALGNTYNLSQNIEIEQMVKSILTGLEIFRVVPRLPESLVKRMVQIFGKLPRFPLTSSRINALTSHCCYDSTKIVNELGFEFHSSLESRFIDFASKVS
jgi:nucleoside-diphosphate-sugar epimerase